MSDSQGLSEVTELLKSCSQNEDWKTLLKQIIMNPKYVYVIEL